MSAKFLDFALASFLLLTACIPGVCSTTEFELSQAEGSSHVRVRVAKSGQYRLEIDDAPGFRAPVLAQSFRGAKLEFDAYAAGLVPGNLYYFRLSSEGPVKRLRLATENKSDVPASCESLRASWEEGGREMIAKRSAIQWDAGTQRWIPSPNGKPEGLSLYFTEFYLRSALESAQSCSDLRLYEEIAQYYMLMLQRTVPLGETERSISRTGMMAARTFPAGGYLIGDSELSNVQWLYPAAKLIRLITLLPSEQRSASMRRFVSEYSGFIVDEHLLRYLTRPVRPAPGRGVDVGRISVWNLTLRGLKGKNVWDTAMSDIDLWILASSAEVLGAHANEPELVSLNQQQVTQLRAALQTGMLLFRSKRTSYPDTRNFQNQTVGSATYFNGDYDTYAEFDYSAAAGNTFPTAQQKRAIPALGWDTSHAYRIPVFLRALYENKKATMLDFPQLQEMRLLTNQYVYRVFNGDFSRPLFRNYLDGNDTWFRVDQASGYGYPPSQFCDMSGSNRPCMAPGDFAGWGLLTFVNQDLAKLERALVRLALEDSADAREFRNRHYSYAGPFEVQHVNGRATYGAPLFFLVADNASLMAK